MRILIILALFFVFVAGHAQLSLSVSAGANSNALHQPPSGLLNKGAYRGGTGWQSGLKAAYGFKHWFVYTGAGLYNANFHVNAASMSLVYFKNTYKPYYISIPVGAGYRLNMGRNIALILYAGVYGRYGLGGNVDYTSESLDTGFPELANPGTRKILFGNTKEGNNPKDLARVNTGLQFGAGLQLLRRLEVNAMYNAGLSNVLSPGAAYRLKLNTLAVNLGYCLYSK